MVSIYWQGVAPERKGPTRIGSTCVAHTSPHSAAAVTDIQPEIGGALSCQWMLAILYNLLNQAQMLKQKQTRNVGQCPTRFRPAEYRWSPLFNAAVWLTPTTSVPYSNAAKTRKPLKFTGVPQTRQRISAVSIGRSSPYCGDMWRTYRCFTSFFRLSIHASYAKIQPDKFVRWCQNGDFLRPVFAAIILNSH